MTVYVVEAVGLEMVKIGFTKNIEQRLSDLRFLCPMPSRARRRKRCPRCGKDGLGRRATYHPACWLEVQSLKTVVGVSKAEGPRENAPE
jgi:hypothetical protein